CLAQPISRKALASIPQTFTAVPFYCRRYPGLLPLGHTRFFLIMPQYVVRMPTTTPHLFWKRRCAPGFPCRSITRLYHRQLLEQRSLERIGCITLYYSIRKALHRVWT